MQACSTEKRMSCGFIDFGKNQFVYKLHTVGWYLYLLVYLEKRQNKGVFHLTFGTFRTVPYGCKPHFRFHFVWTNHNTNNCHIL